MIVYHCWTCGFSHYIGECMFGLVTMTTSDAARCAVCGRIGCREAIIMPSWPPGAVYYHPAQVPIIQQVQGGTWPWT